MCRCSQVCVSVPILAFVMPNYLFNPNNQQLFDHRLTSLPTCRPRLAMARQQFLLPGTIPTRMRKTKKMRTTMTTSLFQMVRRFKKEKKSQIQKKETVKTLVCGCSLLYCPFPFKR